MNFDELTCYHDQINLQARRFGHTDSIWWCIFCLNWVSTKEESEKV